MTTLEGTLRTPVHREDMLARDSESSSFSLVQSVARVLLTLALIVSMSALFASQIYTTLR